LAFSARSFCRLTVSTVLLTVEALVYFLPMSDELARNFGFGSFSALTGVEGNDTGGATFLGFGCKKVKIKVGSLFICSSTKLAYY
jgi:hypothetical protein